MRRIKIALLVSIVLIGGIVFVSLWVNLQGRKVPEEEVPKIPANDANMRMEKIHFVEDKKGRKTWELEANQVQQYQDTNIAILEEVKVTFYTKEGQSFVLTGKKGKVDQDTKDMELTGDVLLVSSEGYQLKTNSIAYQNTKNRITTSDPVEIDGEQIRLTGKGMEVDMEAKTFRVLRDVKTRLKTSLMKTTSLTKTNKKKGGKKK